MFKEIYIKQHSPKWFQKRTQHIGSSEMAAVCSIWSEALANETYVSGLKVYLEKIGEPVAVFEGNIHTKAGQALEPYITDLYRGYDPHDDNPEHVYDNYNSGNNRLNRVICKRVFCYNDEYPHIIVSPDAKGYTGTVNDYGLECKSTNSKDAGKYLNKVSPAFIIQVQTVLMITGWKYIDIAILIDGKFFHVHREFPDKEWKDFILDCSISFWERVLQAHQVKIKYNIQNYYDIHEDFMPEEWKTPKDELNGNSPIGVLHSLEPDMSGSSSEKDFIKKHIIPRDEDLAMEITTEQLEWMAKYKENLEAQKNAENKKSKWQNKLIVSLGGYNKAYMPDNERAYFSYKKNKNGDVRFYPSDELLNQL